MRFAVLGGILLLCAVAAQAKVYKWVDAQGGVHYSASPPPDARASEVRVAPAPPSARTAADSAADTAAERGSAAAAGERSGDSAANDAFKQNCEIVRQNLKVLEDPTNRRFREEGMEPVYYTDQQRQAKIDEASEMIETYCETDGEQ